MNFPCLISFMLKYAFLFDCINGKSKSIILNACLFIEYIYFLYIVGDNIVVPTSFCQPQTKKKINIFLHYSPLHKNIVYMTHMRSVHTTFILNIKHFIILCRFRNV